jgi:hypothetical protein
MAFEAFLTQRVARARPTLWRRVTVVLSLGLHGALLLAAAVYSFWRVDEVMPPAVAVTFAGGWVAAPPPPSRPPPVHHELPRVRSKVAKPDPAVPALVQPSEPPNDRPPPPSSDLADDGEPGTQQGAPAGMLGDTGIAALATMVPPPPPRAPEIKPVTLPPSIGSGQRITDINDPRFRPSLPGPLNRAGVMLWGLFRICVGADGDVTNVKVLKTAEPTVDGEWARVIQTWQYRPYSIDGRPTPFCHTMRLEVRGAS